MHSFRQGNYLSLQDEETSNFNQKHYQNFMHQATSLLQIFQQLWNLDDIINVVISYSNTVAAKMPRQYSDILECSKHSINIEF
jgi:hypothetical protein